jgi:hypothetical protein
MDGSMLLIRHISPNRNYNLNDIYDVGYIMIANKFPFSIVIVVTFIQSYYVLLKA